MTDNFTRKETRKNIPINLIDENKDNESIFGYDDLQFMIYEIQENGFRGCIEVYQKNDGRYEISSGHMRYRAAKELGYIDIPCLVSEDTDDVTKAKNLIMSNIHQRRMSPMNWTRSIDYYKNNVLKNESFEGTTRSELAKRFNLSETTVQRYLSLSKLIPEFQKFAEQPEFKYSLFDNVPAMNKEDQKKLYDMLSDISNGNIQDLSKVIIDQYINKIQLQKENSLKHEPRYLTTVLTEKEFAAQNNSVSEDNVPINEFSETSSFSDFSDGFEEAPVLTEEIQDANDIEALYNKVHMNFVDGEIKYYISKIAVLLNSGYIENKRELSEEIERLLEKLE